MKHFYIETYGCQMNKNDSLDIAESLRSEGFAESKSETEADIIIINTCSVRQSAENRIKGRIGYYKWLKSKKKLTLIIAGCMAERLGKDFFKEHDAVDIVVGTYFRDRIPLILSNYSSGEKSVYCGESDFSFSKSMPDKDNPQKAFVSISRGCNNYCSYCIVPYLRGRELSRSSISIIDEVKRLSDIGVKQVTLLGQNVNSYGKDNNDISFANLLKKISRETSISWIKYLSSHPKDFNDELIDVIAEEEKISKWLHLALQSGSDKILKDMNRHYTAGFFIGQVEKLKQKAGKINLTTDVIVGFPGESESDFQDTVDILKSLEFDDAFMYKYNPRKGTAAYAHYKDDISSECKRDRLSMIIELQRSISRKKRKERINDIYPAITEKWSRQEKNEILALTKDDIMIIFNGSSDDFGKVFNLKVMQLKGSTLIGEKILS